MTRLPTVISSEFRNIIMLTRTHNRWWLVRLDNFFWTISISKFRRSFACVLLPKAWIRISPRGHFPGLFLLHLLHISFSRIKGLDMFLSNLIGPVIFIRPASLILALFTHQLSHTQDSEKSGICGDERDPLFRAVSTTNHHPKCNVFISERC